MDAETKPPAKKGVFKGKRRKPTFTRNRRTGSEQKGGVTTQRYREAIAAAKARGAPASTANPIVSSPTRRGSRAANTSPSKAQIKAALRQTTKDLRSAAAARDLAIAKNSNLQKKLAAKEVTVKKAKADSIKFKAATRKSERGRNRLERALERERDLRQEDAVLAQEALRRERHEFQLCLKAAISEVKVSAFGCTIILLVLTLSID